MSSQSEIPPRPPLRGEFASFGAVLVLILVASGCQLPPRDWDMWDGTPDADISDEDSGIPDGGTDAETGGDAEADDGGPEDGGEMADADEPVDLCEGVFCLPDETCDPETGECWSDGLGCGEIASCWLDQNMDLGALATCLVGGSAEGRRDFVDLVSCLLQNCLNEVLNSGGDMMGIGMCAFNNCPSQLVPCASGFF